MTANEIRRAETIAFIKRRMKEMKLSARGLSLKSGCTADAVRNLLRGQAKNWRADTEAKIMNYLSENRAYLTGWIGGGDEVELVPQFNKIITPAASESADLIDCETFLVPSEFSRRVVHAWKVKDSWEGPFLRAGDMLWTTEIRYENLDDYLDSEVLVHLRDRRTFIKKLMRGGGPGKYSLMGLSVHGFMKDVDIVWCALIIGHIKKLPG